MRVKKTKRARLFAALLLAGLFASAGASESLACSCREVTVCEAFGGASAVFIGRVTGGTRKLTYKDEHGAEVSLEAGDVSIDVQEVFSGPQMTQTRVNTGNGMTSCDTGLLRGVTYLIYAYGKPGAYSTGTCTRTSPVAEAGEDLKFLRELPQAGVGGRIFGIVFKPFSRSAVAAEGRKPPEPEGLPGIEVTIRRAAAKGARAGRPRKLVTDAGGRYELGGVEPGIYEVGAALPEGYSDEDTLQKVKVGDRGCAPAYFAAVPDGRVSGRVLDAEGRPVAKAKVALVARDREPVAFHEDGFDYLNGDGDGRFEIDDVPPGEYVLGVNLTLPPDSEVPYPATYYPGVADRSQAAIIRVGLGQKLSGFVLRLPPRLVERRVRGRVVWPDGSPAANVNVSLEDRERPGWYFDGGNRKTDADGRFDLVGFEGRDYWVHAANNDAQPDQPALPAAHAEPLVVTLHGDAFDLKLVLSSEGGYCEHYKKRGEK